MWNEVVTLFREYMGQGLIIGWFLLSILYLWKKEKQQHIRILFVYVPVILLLLFFNPLFARFVYGMIGDEIYYRILWLIPVTPVLAYTIVQIRGELKGKKRIFFSVISILLIMVSGSFMYRNPHFKKADNLYHIPQHVVDICDAIEVEGREVMGVFPADMIQYVRQYTPFVCMPYGRDLLVERWNFSHPLFEAMEEDVVDVERISTLARESYCHYIIVPQEKRKTGTFEEYSYEFFDNIGGYDIYLDIINPPLVP